MKTSLPFSQNLFFKSLGKAIFFAFPLFLHAQAPPTTPLETPQETRYPGSFESFEKLIQFDEQRFDAKTRIVGNHSVGSQQLKDPSKLDIDPDFMNSLILNSPSGYLRLAAKDRCAFYDVLLADLLRTKEGPVKRILVQYQAENGEMISASMNKKDFLEKVVLTKCARVRDTVALFQVKTIPQAIKATKFEMPRGREQCDAIHAAWLDDPKSPYWCQINDIISDYEDAERSGKKSSDKSALAKVLRGKLTDNQRDYIHNFCRNADNPKLFCDEFFATNFFSKVVEQLQPEILIKDVCQEALGKEGWSPALLRACVAHFRDNQDSCLWGKTATSGLSPRTRCDHLSLALNHSSLFAAYDDCPRNSDNTGVTNFARLLSHLEPGQAPPVTTSGFCSATSATTVYGFLKAQDQEELWTARMCYEDKIEGKEKCLPFHYGDSPSSPISVSKVLGEILYRTKGLPREVQCKTVMASDFKPDLLEFRYGCFLVVNPDDCGISRCSHKVFVNEREVKGLKPTTPLLLDYFPTSVERENGALTVLLYRGAKHKTRNIPSLPSMEAFFKDHPKGLIHGMGCAEDLLPGFFRKNALAQCSPLPFIVDGIIRDGDRVTLVTRTAADNLHAPRLIGWGTVFSAVRSHQVHSNLKTWGLNAVY